MSKADSESSTTNVGELLNWRLTPTGEESILRRGRPDESEESSTTNVGVLLRPKRFGDASGLLHALPLVVGFATRHQPCIHLIPKVILPVIARTRRQRGATGREATSAASTPGQIGEPGQSPKPSANADEGRGHWRPPSETMEARTRT